MPLGPAGQLKNRLLARLFTAFPALARRWARGLSADTGDVPWTPVETPLARSRVALVTTGGVHLRSQAPFDMADPDGDPSWREIPSTTPAEALTITHNYYDHRDADRDLNLVLPLERLRELEAAGAVGGLAPTALGFMGHIDGPHLDTLVRRTAPEAARRLAREGADCALLVPA